MICNIVLNVLLVVLLISEIIQGLKKTYKISYYEIKLENRGCNIDHIKNIKFRTMFKG